MAQDRIDFLAGRATVIPVYEVHVFAQPSEQAIILCIAHHGRQYNLVFPLEVAGKLNRLIADGIIAVTSAPAESG